MKELTKAEEEVMQVLWQLKQAFVKEILAEMPEPRPAYNTVSTIVRILEQKGLVSYEAFGKSHRYFPLITKESYSKQRLTGLVDSYFNGSFSNLVSFFVQKENVDAKELDKILQMIEEKRNEP